LAEIQARTIPLEQLPLPVVVNLRELARGNQPDDMGAMLLDALSVRYPVRGHLEAWCREKLRSLDCWLLMDALDEVDDNRRPRIIEFLRTIVTQGWQCRVIMTCQTANYHPGLLLWPKFTEYELAPLDLSEIQTFIGQWFGEQDPRAERLSAAIGVDRVLQGFCRSPLLATLLCLASEELHEEPSRLALYQQVLHGLLRRWRVEEEPTNALHIDDLVYLLQTMAWRLFVAFPGANRFTSKQVVDAIASANRGGRMEASAREIRDELVQAGLMVCADLNAEGEHQLSFLHRLIFECLVADHLRRAVMQAGW
jgi:predicted NACHT family NTPase